MFKHPFDFHTPKEEALMSQVLYALVLLQGTSGLTFSPGYTTAAECMQQYKGRNVACFNYDPEGASWTAFFKLPDGAFRVVRRIPNEGECRRYIDAFKSAVGSARHLQRCLHKTTRTTSASGET